MLNFDQVIVILRKFFNDRRFFCLATTCTIFQCADKSIIFLPCIRYLENISIIPPPPPMGKGGSILGSWSITCSYDGTVLVNEWNQPKSLPCCQTSKFSLDEWLHLQSTQIYPLYIYIYIYNIIYIYIYILKSNIL